MDASRSRPATVDDLIAADRANGWDLIVHDATSDTCMLRCSLWIGSVSIWRPTYFQVGRASHPAETLVVQGDVWIRSPRPSMERRDGRPGLVNRLTLGDPDDDRLRPTLKIACETDGQYGLFIGSETEELGRVHGGELFIYNGTLTAAVPDKEHRWSGHTYARGPRIGWLAARVELVGATVSWVAGTPAWGMDADRYRIEDTLFEHCGTALRKRRQKVKDCVFRHITGPAISGKRVECVRCVFEGNDRNWEVQWAAGTCVEMINCRIEPGKLGVFLKKNLLASKRLVRMGVPVYPFYVERRSCRVKVVDNTGRPVGGALVWVTCRDDLHADKLHVGAVRNSMVLTDANGMTPARVEDGAILPAVRRLEATDNPAQPVSHPLQYTLHVSAPGHVTVTRPLPLAALDDEQTVTLKPE